MVGYEKDNWTPSVQNCKSKSKSNCSPLINLSKTLTNVLIQLLMYAASMQRVAIISAATIVSVIPDTKRDPFGIKMKNHVSTVTNVQMVLIIAVTIQFVSILMAHTDATACRASNVVLGDQIYNHAQVS